MSAPVYECECGYTVYEGPEHDWWETDELIDAHEREHEDDARRPIDDPALTTPVAEQWSDIEVIVPNRMTQEHLDQRYAEVSPFAGELAKPQPGTTEPQPRGRGALALLADLAALALFVGASLAAILFTIDEVLR